MLALTMGMAEFLMMSWTSFLLFCGTRMLISLCVCTRLPIDLREAFGISRIVLIGILAWLSVLCSILIKIAPALQVDDDLCRSMVPLSPRYNLVVLIAIPGCVLQTTLIIFSGMCIRSILRLPGSAQLWMMLFIGLGNLVIRLRVEVTVLTWLGARASWLTSFVFALDVWVCLMLVMPACMT